MLRRETIDTVIFDLDGTLRESQPTYNQALLSFCMQLGFQGGRDHQRRALRWLHYYWAQSPELLADVEKYGDYGDQFWINHSRLYLQSYGCQPERAVEMAPDLYQCMDEGYNPADSLNEGVVDLLQSLADYGYKLGVISNRRKPFDAQLEELGIDPYFDYALAAGTINTWKPDPAIFQHALEKMGSEAEKTLYVGDNYFADVVGSTQAGVQAVLIDPEALFPEADCQVIHSISELRLMLDE